MYEGILSKTPALMEGYCGPGVKAGSEASEALQLERVESMADDSSHSPNGSLRSVPPGMAKETAREKKLPMAGKDGVRSANVVVVASQTISSAAHQDVPVNNSK